MFLYNDALYVPALHIFSPYANVRAVTPLLLAIDLGKLRNAELLISRGADVNLCDSNGRTPLLAISKSSSYNLTALLATLVSKGANVNSKDEDDMTPLHYASAGAMTDMVSFFINAGADVNAKSRTASTPLHLVCDNGAKPDSIRCARMLVENGAFINLSTCTYIHHSNVYFHIYSKELI